MANTKDNGFAKGNFTMLDNLKLGYGGTKEEMQRLLEDAEKLSGIEYDISSFADISEAIHVMQEEMGIAGTTAREAATTIEGSIGMMKGAWQNLVVGLADENANIESLTYDLVESILAVSDNLMPRIEQTLAGISQLVEGVAPIIATLLPQMLETLLPSLLTAASSLMTSLCNALPGLVTTLLPPLIEASLSVITTLFNMLPELLATVLPLLITAAFDICMAFLNVVTENGPQFLQTGIDAVVQLVAGISEMLPEIIAAAIALITELVNTLTNEENLNLLIETAFSLIDTIVTGLMDNLPALIAAAIQLVTNLVSYITEPGNLAKLLSMALDLILTIMNGLIDAIPQLVSAAIELVMQLVSFLLEPGNLAMLIDAALTIVMTIAAGLLQAAGELLAGAIELITQLCDEFTNTDWAAIGSEIIDSLLSGLKTAWTSVSSWFSGVWSSLFNKKVSVSADSNGNVSVGGYATGLNWVPYDNFPALLHRGEAVLTAAEARSWRNGQGATPAMAGVTINQYIQSVPQTPAEMAATTEAYFEQARWML